MQWSAVVLKVKAGDSTADSKETILSPELLGACLYKSLCVNKRGIPSENPLMTDKFMNYLAEKA